MAPERLSWRRSAGIAAAGLAAAQIAGSIVVGAFFALSDRESSGIGAAGLMIFFGFPISIAVYFLAGVALLRMTARRLHGAIAIRESSVVLLLAGSVSLVVGGLLSDLLGDDRAALADAVFLAGGLPVAVALGTVLVRLQARSIRTPGLVEREEVG